MNPALSAAHDVGPPVNPVSGRQVLADTEDLDFTLEGPLPLEWQRSYHSNSARAGWFGQGWSSPLEVSLQSVSDPKGEFIDHIDCIDLFGRHIELPYVAPGGSFFSAPNKITLARSAQGQYRVETQDGLTYWFHDMPGGIHQLAMLSDRNGNAIRLDYQVADGVLARVDVACSGGQRIELVFYAARLREIIERRERPHGTERSLLMRYEYTPQGQLAKVHNRAGECMRAFEYNAELLITHQVYAGDFESWFEYAGRGPDAKVTKHWDNVGQTWTFDYQPMHTAVLDQDGRRFVYHFDEQKRWTGYTDPLGRFTRYGIDRNGNLRAVVDPGENITETTFDERSNPIETRDPTGAVTKIEWHPVLPLPISITDPLNRATLYEYDARGNLVLETEPDGAQTLFEVDERGLTTAITDAKGGTSRLQYNQAAQITCYTDCSQRATRFEYDEHGNLEAIIDALGQRTTYTYDAVGRMLSETRPDGSRDTYENDLADRPLKVTNAIGAATRYRYAPDGLLLEEIDALGHSRHYRYDSRRELVEVINENGASYRFAYDALDRLVEEIAFDGTRRHYGYGLDDEPISIVDAPESAVPLVTRLRRDAMGRLLLAENGSGKTTFVYDAAGQMLECQNGKVRLSYQYDQTGQVVEETTFAPGHAHSLKHSYDPLGNRLCTTLPDGTALGALYYGSEHVHQISLDGVPVTDFERDALHEETSRTQGALQTIRTYDAAGRRLQQTARPALPGATGLAQIERRYAYDRADRLLATAERGRQLDYGYDAIDRLTRFNTERFAFDPAHNMAPGTAAVAAVDNRVTAYEDKRYRYDLYGRIAEKQIGADTVIQFKWNDSHQLAESSRIDLQATQDTRYLYDPLGRRVAKHGPGGTTWFVWDDDRLLQEWGSDGVERTFIYEPDAFEPLAEAVKPLGSKDPAQIRYYHCDQIGLPREVTDAQGHLLWEARFRGWGRVAEELASMPQALRYQGQYFDTETGLHYNLMRYYDPDFGRFISKDPIGMPGGLNEYQYAPNPVFWVDPTGLTGTYIMSGGKTRNYVGKGPKARSQASKRARMKGCKKVVLIHKDYKDDEMGFMVEHLLMKFYNARKSKKWANSSRLDSPGKKKFAKASKKKKAAARRKYRAIKKEFEDKKKACGL